MEIYHSGSGHSEILGPKNIEEEKKNGKTVYHVFIDDGLLQQARIDRITQISLITCPKSERVIYGHNGDEFNQRVQCGKFFADFSYSKLFV